MNIVFQVIRSIHPVGQGAFYTEKLHRPGSVEDKHIVYDCGALPFNNNLKREIVDFLPKGSTIDVLFISHFHADHVNGIRLLSQRYNIKNVVLPQIDDYDWFYIVENFLTNGNPDVNIISDVLASIGDARLVQVAPVVENDDNMAVSNDPIVLNDDFKGGIINGRFPLEIDGNARNLWHYIIVNPLVKGDLEELKKAILDIDYKGRKLTIEELHDPNILTEVKDDLRSVYTKVFKGGNEYSMCMLSELADRKHLESFLLFNNGPYNYLNHRRFFYYDHPFHSMDGCLYCGDADFLHYPTLDYLKRRLKGREHNVGLLQLPHHGSKENFNINMLNWLCYLIVSFACFGSPNRHRHPSASVMRTASVFSTVIGVNQYKTNLLLERVDVIGD